MNAKKHYRAQYIAARDRGDEEGKVLALREYERAGPDDEVEATSSASGLRKRIDDQLGIPESEQLPSSSDLKNAARVFDGRYSIITPKAKEG